MRVCMCVFVYIGIHRYIYIYICIHTSTSTCVYIYIYIYICTYIYIYIYIHIYGTTRDICGNMCTLKQIRCYDPATKCYDLTNIIVWCLMATCAHLNKYDKRYGICMSSVYQHRSLSCFRASPPWYRKTGELAKKVYLCHRFTGTVAHLAAAVDFRPLVRVRKTKRLDLGSV